MSSRFVSKAGTLRGLKGILKGASIPEMVCFRLDDWRSDPKKCRQMACAQFGLQPLAVRSSCSREDTKEHSNAGAFATLLNVLPDGMEEAINQVFASYGTPSANDEVLIQPMLEKVVQSGVAFSHDPSSGSPYRIISWADGPDTTIVTSGKSEQTFQIAASAVSNHDSNLSPVLELLEELLLLFGNLPLDIEFATTIKNSLRELWLLQVRPLFLSNDVEKSSIQLARLEQVKKKVNRNMRPHPFLLGSSTVYGVMPDWNPAEIIGIKPKPLALSLYRELITDSVWAYQRHNYGYRNLRSFMLMPNFFGCPYIDVRVSFNSFIPAALDEDIGARLVDYYLDRLVAEPKLHDKVEFEIVWSCYTFDLRKNLQTLYNKGFSDRDQNVIAECLRQITNSVFNAKNSLWLKDLKRISILNERRKSILGSNLGPVEQIYWLIEDAKRYGSLPFAGVARAGFMAVQILRSLETIGVFSDMDYEHFMSSISSVSSRMGIDQKRMSKPSFLKEYGHLRPGTYDILSPRYDETPDRYFDWEKDYSEIGYRKDFSANRHQLNEIGTLLQSNRLEIKADALLKSLKSAIEQREWAKFEFTRNLSDALLIIKRIGDKYGIDANDLAFCNYQIFKELQVSEQPIKCLLNKSIEDGKRRYSDTLKLSLPSLITNERDIFEFKWPEMMPTFITRKRVIGRVVCLGSEEPIEGAIVCIPNADPGFDWLFTQSIIALITEWGGANSHMAIRAGEQNLPAVIGAGELLYRRWSSAKLLQIECAEHRVEILK